MDFLDEIAKATHDQRMRGMFPGFDEKAAIHPRLGIGPILSYEELPEDSKKKERDVAKAAIDTISALSIKTGTVNINPEETRDPATITNDELIRHAFVSSDPIKSLLGERLNDLEKQLSDLKISIALKSLTYLKELQALWGDPRQRVTVPTNNDMPSDLKKDD